MIQIPDTENPVVIRTDFSNQAAWEKICGTIRKPVGIFRFRANVEFLDDPEYAGLTKDQFLECVPKNYNRTFIIIVDQFAISDPDHPLLIIDLYDGSGRDFRAIPSKIQGIENNLSIGNMDFEEFADAVDEDGVFRGFPKN
jgi:uncharacterized protein YbcV (DUF1398 family)